ncbi:hypothetical protein TrRE_jg10562, partial [Triparma retinervis]
EVEDLYTLLSDVITRYPTVRGVSTGAIFSTYQRSRVESVARRLNLQVLSYLWQPEPPDPEAPPARPPSYAMQDGGMLSVSKICPSVTAGHGVVSQTLQVLSSLSALLSSLSMSPQDVFSAHLYLS